MEHKTGSGEAIGDVSADMNGLFPAVVKGEDVGVLLTGVGDLRPK
jgi:hypothetical protein